MPVLELFLGISWIRWPILLTSVLLVTGCQPNSSNQEVVRIAVASSAHDALLKLKPKLATAARAEVQLLSGASSKLANQIVWNGEVDLFLSAHDSWVKLLEEKNLVTDEIQLFANRLVLVAPADSKINLAAFEDLADEQVTKIAVAGKHVPAGMYARDAILNAGLDLNSKLVSAENVRIALAFVERGEVDLGIVYSTDAIDNGLVKVVVEIDSSLHDPIRYVLAKLNHGEKAKLKHREGRNSKVEELYQFLQNSESLSVFGNRGFQRIAND